MDKRFEGGIPQSNEGDKPLEFAQLKQMYDNTVEQLTDLLQRIDPEIKSKLLQSGKVPKKFDERSDEKPKTNQPAVTRSHPPNRTQKMYSEESDKEIGTKPPETSMPEASHETLSEISDEQSETEFVRTSEVTKVDAPGATNMAVAPLLLEMAATTILPTVTTAAKNYFRGMDDGNLTNLQNALTGQNAPSGFFPSAFSYSPQGALQPPNQYGQGMQGVGGFGGAFQPQIPPGQGVQNPQTPYQTSGYPRPSLAQGVPVTYPQGQQLPVGQMLQRQLGPNQTQRPPGQMQLPPGGMPRRQSSPNHTQSPPVGFPMSQQSSYPPQSRPGQMITPQYPQAPYQKMAPNQGQRMPFPPPAMGGANPTQFKTAPQPTRSAPPPFLQQGLNQAQSPPGQIPPGSSMPRQQTNKPPTLSGQGPDRAYPQPTQSQRQSTPFRQEPMTTYPIYSPQADVNTTVGAAQTTESTPFQRYPSSDTIPPSGNDFNRSQIPPDNRPLNEQNKSSELKKLQGEVLQSLADIDNQIHVILGKLE